MNRKIASEPASGEQGAASRVPNGASSGARRTYVSQADVPAMPLGEALRVPMALRDEYGGRPTSPMDLAIALNVAPGGSQLRLLTGASMAFGFTEGGAQADSIVLTDLGRRVVAPMVEGDDLAAKREGFLRPRVIGDFLKRYNGSPFPSDLIAKNVLETLGVPRAALDRTLDLISTGAASLGLLVNIKDKRYVRLDGPTSDVELPQPALDDSPLSAEDEGPEVSGDEAVTIPRTPDIGPKPIFIGHGRKKMPLEKLKGILDSFKIPYRIAVNEPNLGRPIPKKVKDVMSLCGSAILIFTCDEELRDESGEVVWRPSENVVHELGAASYAYEDRVVIFKEQGLHFPANYQSIGHIEFREDSIEAKTTELLKELIGFGIVRITPA